MLTPVRSRQFKRDIRRTRKRGKDLSRLRLLLDALIRRTPLAASHLDHPLGGPWKGYREIHIEPDWLLIYRVTGDDLHLVRTGSHTDLFDSWTQFDVGARLAACRPLEGQGESKRSPGLMPQRLTVPALSSSTRFTGSPDEMLFRLLGWVSVAMLAMAPSARMKSMSSDT